MARIKKRFEVFGGVNKRGRIGNKQVVWDITTFRKMWPITLAEIKRAAKEEFSGVFHGLLTLEQDNCSITMKVDKDSYDDNNTCLGKRYKIVPSRNSQSMCVVWYYDVLKKDRLTLEEIETTAEEEYPNNTPSEIVLQKYDCGIVMRIEYEKLKETLKCSE